MTLGGLLKVIKNDYVVVRSDVEEETGSGKLPGTPDPRTRLLQEAFDRGKAEGLKEGYEQGHKDGTAEGLEQGRKTGRDEGLSAGLEQGRTEGLERGRTETRAELEKQFTLIAQIGQEYQNQRRTLMTDAERDLLKLALMIAEKIVRVHLQENDHIKDFVKRLLSVVADKTTVFIRLCEEDAALLAACKNELASAQGAEAVNIVSDSTLSHGDCIIETNSGNYDARVLSQLTEVRRRLPLE